MDWRIWLRDLNIPEIRETLADPDAIEPAEYYENRNIYTKNFGNYDIVVVLEETKSPRLAVTVWKDIK